MSGRVRLIVKEGESSRGSEGAEEQDQDATSNNNRRPVEFGGDLEQNKHNWTRKWRERISRHEYEDGVKKAKQAVISRFTKPQVLFERLSSFSSSSSPNPSSLPRPDSESSSDRNIWKRGFREVRDCKCLSHPQTDENIEISDEDDLDGSVAHLKSMIEKNDYYCNECNTHSAN